MQHKLYPFDFFILLYVRDCLFSYSKLDELTHKICKAAEESYVATRNTILCLISLGLIVKDKDDKFKLSFSGLWRAYCYETTMKRMNILD